MGAWPRQGSKEKTEGEHNREIARQKPLGTKRRTQKQHQKKNKRQETHMAIPGTQISDPNNLGQAAANPVVAMVAASKFFLGRLFRPGESCLVYTCSFDRGKEKLTYVGVTVVPSGMSQAQALGDRKRRLLNPPAGVRRVFVCLASWLSGWLAGKEVGMRPCLFPSHWPPHPQVVKGFSGWVGQALALAFLSGGARRGEKKRDAEGVGFYIRARLRRARAVPSM